MQSAATTVTLSKRMQTPRVLVDWTPERIEKLRDMRAKGASAGRIAAALDVTRNAVIGKLYRLKPEPDETVAKPSFDWTEPRIEMLRRLWDRDVPSREIAAKIGTSAGSVRDKAARLGLTPRASGALRVARRFGGQAAASGRPAHVASAPVPALVVPIATAIPKHEPAPDGGIPILEVADDQCSWIVAGEREHARCCGAKRQRRTIFKLCEAHLAASISPQFRAGRRG